VNLGNGVIVAETPRGAPNHYFHRQCATKCLADLVRPRQNAKDDILGLVLAHDQVRDRTSETLIRIDAAFVWPNTQVPYLLGTVIGILHQRHAAHITGLRPFSGSLLHAEYGPHYNFQLYHSELLWLEGYVHWC
jgi:hypothetical protein